MTRSCDYCERPATAKETVQYVNRTTITWTCDFCGLRTLIQCSLCGGIPCKEGCWPTRTIRNLEAVRTGAMVRDAGADTELLRRKFIRVNRAGWYDLTPAGRELLATR